MASLAVARTAVDALRSKTSALDAGYDPVRSNGDVYGKLLRRISQGTTTMATRNAKDKGGAAAAGRRAAAPRRHRQTPLVNAGYAARVAAVSAAVERFVSCHCTGRGVVRRDIVGADGNAESARQIGDGAVDGNRGGVEDSRCSETVINVVMLGCGMDALGIWSHSLCPEAVRVYEIDCTENCLAKKAVLCDAGILQLSSAEGKGDDGNDQGGNESRTQRSEEASSSVVAAGDLNIASSLDGTDPTTSSLSPPTLRPEGPASYTLLAANLCDVTSLRRAISDAQIDLSRPTVVVSELVLAYLGRTGADAVLSCVGSDLCVAPGSVFLAYEPIDRSVVKEGKVGGENVGGDSTILSVADGYAADYYRQFSSKLNRGRHNDGKPVAVADNSDFHPLGSDCSKVVTRLRTCGFGGPLGCCLAGVAAASVSPKMKATEFFDEHAALVLHLSSYVLTAAFSPTTSDVDVVRRICPWSDQTNFEMAHYIRDIKISPIQSVDQEDVRDLFRGTYTDLFDEFPSVKKMVKAALKADLSGKRPDLLETGGGIFRSNSEGRIASAVRTRYRMWGGEFWVATVHAKGDGDERVRRKVVGFVGVRASAAPGRSTARPPRILTYEIQRLAVDGEYRGRGVGRALLKTAEGFVRMELFDAELVATTPKVQQAANELYVACGFHLRSERTMGKMIMRTYAKKIKPA